MQDPASRFVIVLGFLPAADRHGAWSRMDSRVMQNACAVAPEAPNGPGPTPEDEDWLTMPEDDLAAMHAEALALFRHPATTAMAGRIGASLALLHQLLVARGVVRALGLPAAEARAAMRSDHALGYYFGLAMGADRSAPPRPERQVAGILVMLHDLVHGRRFAEQLTASLLDGGTMAVGAGFGEGMLAAVEDLAALEGWRRGKRGGMPGGLLEGLPWAGWAPDRAGDHRH